MTYEQSKTERGEHMSDEDLVLISKLEAISSRSEWIIKEIRAQHDHQVNEGFKALKQSLIDLNYFTFKDDYAAHVRLANAFNKAAENSSAHVNSGPKSKEFDVEGMFNYEALSKRLVW